jgi:hypothetical protein
MEVASPLPRGASIHWPSQQALASPCSSDVRRHREDEAAIRAVYEQRGEFAAGLELRRLFPGITDNAQARKWARTIASWKPLPVKRAPKVPQTGAPHD